MRSWPHGCSTARASAWMLPALLLSATAAVAQVPSFTPIETFTPNQTFTPIKTFTRILTFTPVQSFTPIPSSTVPALRTRTASRTPTVTPSTLATATGSPGVTGTITATPSRVASRTPTPEPPATESATPLLCSGDCDGDTLISIEELILGVRIALGQSPLATCVALDLSGNGAVEVAELIRAVGLALQGCV